MAVVAAALLLAGPAPLGADDFGEDLARVDAALRKGSERVPWQIRESCLGRRNTAVRLYQIGQIARAERSLKYCIEMLHIPERASVERKQKAGPSMEEIQARAASEVEKALALTPNVTNGLTIYRECAGCHMPEGWGLSSGSVPQIAGQHRNVVIKQLADIRAGNRDNFLMLPYSSVKAIGGAQAVADVAAYIDTLEISTANDKGSGDDLALGARLYQENCSRCHGGTGEGNNDEYVPRIQSQHYAYLVRQFEWIREGRRRNANAEMLAQIRDFEEREMSAVLDYVSRLEPPPELQAPPGWYNPDFPRTAGR